MTKDQLISFDRDHIWHPFTQMKDYQDFDHVAIQSGQGVKLYDVDGKEYYDTIASWWCNTIGHRHPAMVQALKEQLDILHHVNFSGFTHPYAVKVVEEMQQVMDPTLSRYYFSDDGSTAMEVAVKIAFQYWKNQGRDEKKLFVHLADSYHGDTIGSLSVGGIEVYHLSYSALMFESLSVPSPVGAAAHRERKEYTYDASDPDWSEEGWPAMEKSLRKNAHRIAGVVVEPLLMGAAGMYVYPPAYLRKLRALTRELDILLIFDEVVTGFGRTGDMFAYQKAGAVPDIIGLAKGLTGGTMPLSLTVCTEEIFRAFYDDYLKYKTFFHGHSYTANPLACVAASTNLRVFREEKILDTYAQDRLYFQEKIREFASLDFVDDIRYLGWAGAVDIVREQGKSPGTGTPFSPETRIGLKIYQNSLKNGLVLRPLGDSIYWMLPLVTTKQDIRIIMERSMDVIRETVEAARHG